MKSIRETFNSSLDFGIRFGSFFAFTICHGFIDVCWSKLEVSLRHSCHNVLTDGKDSFALTCTHSHNGPHPHPFQVVSKDHYCLTQLYFIGIAGTATAILK
jgi:hypothetical protein